MVLQMQMQTQHEHIMRISALARHLGRLPRSDAADDSAAFYTVKTKACAQNGGVVLSVEDKIAVLERLTPANELLLDSFFDRLPVVLRLKRVATGAEVTSKGTIQLRHNRKTSESILAKANRPEILTRNPQYGVEHVRDSFRFKAVVFSFDDALRFVLAMDQRLYGQGLYGQADTAADTGNACPFKLHKDSTLSSTVDRDSVGDRRESTGRGRVGRWLTTRTVAKLDVAKLQQPKEWGWRFLALDLIFPNSQIVECYIVFQPMELTKKLPDTSAPRCAGVSNHGIFECWRNRELQKLSKEEKVEYEADKRESNRRYNQAWEKVESRANSREVEAFWEPFKESRKESIAVGAKAAEEQRMPESNPMTGGRAAV
jgi:hypothetical protein